MKASVDINYVHLEDYMCHSTYPEIISVAIFQ
jgi:hypothetical protein